MSQALYQAFCRNVRERMTELKISQSELAERLGVTPGYVSQILNNHRRPGLDTLDEFATALETDAARLIKILAKTA